MDALEKIEKYRKQKGWSVYKLAMEAGLSQSALSNMYARGTQPSLFTLTNICEAFGITLSQFFDEDAAEAMVLSQSEKTLVHEYRRMSRENRELILSLTKKLD